jgi:hypothetical protein
MYTCANCLLFERCRFVHQLSRPHILKKNKLSLSIQFVRYFTRTHLRFSYNDSIIYNVDCSCFAEFLIIHTAGRRRVTACLIHFWSFPSLALAYLIVKKFDNMIRYMFCNSEHLFLKANISTIIDNPYI